MTESGDNTDAEKDESELDLSSLLNEDAFGPDWAVGGKKGGVNKTPFQRKQGSRDKRDRSTGSRDGAHRQRQGGGRSLDRCRGGPRDRRPERPYQPNFDVQLQPQGQAFAALLKAMRASCRTYELFEIALLILSKPDRFTAKILPKESVDPAQDSFHISVPDGIGFETEEEAVAHVLANHMDRFFDVEEVELEPPKGTFNVVNRCSLTGDLLGPPNYHRYQHILQEHFTSKIQGMPFEKFNSRIETVSDQEVIDAWVETMKKGKNYKVKGGEEGFNHLEEARRHLLLNHKAKLVKISDVCRVHGKDLEKLPHNRIRRSVEAVLENQRKFPLEFANHLRGRFRRAKFTIYKRGGRGGVTYVCAICRQYRTRDSAFSDSIQKLISFIDNNKDLTAHQILTDASVSTQPREESIKKTEGGEEAEAKDESKIKKECMPEPGPETTAEFFGEKPKSPTLVQDLRWLIESGFVTEYTDGRLFAPPIREEKQSPPKSKESAVASESRSEQPAVVEDPTETSEVEDQSVTESTTEETPSEAELASEATDSQEV